MWEARELKSITLPPQDHTRYSRPLLPVGEKQTWTVSVTQHSFHGHVTQSLLLKGVLHMCMTLSRRTNPSHPSLCFLDLTQLTG